MATRTHDEAVKHKDSAAQLAPPGAVWHHTIEPTPQAAVDFLNRPHAQVAGEAFVSNRSDGQVDVYYFL